MPILINPRAGSSGNPGGLPELQRESGELVIGRGQGSDLLLASPVVSRRHCVISGNGANWQVADTSASGTLLNGCRVAGAQPLRDGDVIAVGDTELVVSIVAVGPSPAPTAPRDARLNLDSWGKPGAAGDTTAQPWPMAGEIPAAGDSLSAMLHAAGVDRRSIAADDALLAQALGSVLQACLAGLAQLAQDRQRARHDLGLPAAAADANPLLQPGSPDQVLNRLLALPPGAARDAVVSAMRALDSHQRATLGAMQGTFAAALDQFAPAAIRQRTAGEAAAWKAYERAFADKDGFTEVFARELARSYGALAGG